MLDSIWQLLFNYGLDTKEIASAMGELIKVVGVDAEGNPIYDGKLAALIDFPVVGTILEAFASFTPPDTLG